MTDEQAARRFVIEELERIRAAQERENAWARRGKECPIQRPMKDPWQGLS